MKNSSEQCPCGSGKALTHCCLPFISGEALPELPEQLMRSRYSAFVLQNADYLCKTTYPSKQHGQSQEDFSEGTFKHVHWLSLRVLNSSVDHKGDTGIVEFVAFHRHKHQEENFDLLQLHERSRFLKEKQQWYYIDGDMLSDIKLGRNDACWCGSGKKMKKCHG